MIKTGFLLRQLRQRALRFYHHGCRIRSFCHFLRTPNIAGAIGLAAAIGYIESIGRSAIFEHDSQLARYAAERLTELPGTRIFGPSGERGALVGFVMDAVHPHDLTTFADQYGLAMRGGHHCNQP